MLTATPLGEETISPVTVIEPYGMGESPYMEEYGQYLSPFQGDEEIDIPLWKQPGVRRAYYILGAVSMAASAFHGYKRNQSVGWAVWWGLMGSFFPVITPTIALAQGFGKEK